jgi:hypothetical protein
VRALVYDRVLAQEAAVDARVQAPQMAPVIGETIEQAAID